MSLGLQATKRRLQSVNSTKKITKAMELVATAKLKTWKDKMVENSEYTQSMIELANDVFSRIDESTCESIFLKENNADKDLYIVVTSNLGLCAGFNYDIFKTVNKNIKPKDKIVMIGTKGYTHYQEEFDDMETSFIDLGLRIEYQKVENMCNYILELFKSGEYQHIKLIYTKYVNSLTFVPDVLTLLPTTKVQKDGMHHKETIMEPSPEEILDALIPLYVKSVVYGKILESQVSEQASRRTAMETATDNSQEIIDKLKIEYNKARQAAITQEITEVVGGSINK